VGSQGRSSVCNGLGISDGVPGTCTLCPPGKRPSLYAPIMHSPQLSGWASLTLIHYLFSLVVSVCAGSFESSCNALAKSIDIPHVTVNFVEHVAHGTNLTFPDNVCRVSCKMLPSLAAAQIVSRIAHATDHTSWYMAATFVVWQCMWPRVTSQV
jgi:hypothetical protein